MKYNFKNLLIVLGLSFISITASAQTEKSSALLKRAQKEYNDLRYAYAIPILESALKQDDNNTHALALLASAYQKTRNYEQAYISYSKLVKHQALQPEWILGYAEVLSNQKKYQESENWYNKYLKLVQNDKRAGAFANINANVAGFMQNRKRWDIQYLNINTNLSEYAPLFYNNSLVFVSNRTTDKITKKVFSWDYTPFSDLYQVNDLTKIKGVNVDSILQAARDLKTVKPRTINDDDTPKTSNDNTTFVDSYNYITDTIGRALSGNDIVAPLIKKVNTKYHEGPAAALPNGGLMFTRNNFFNGKTSRSTDKVIKLKIFESKNANFEKIEPFAYNNDEYSVGHPALNKAGTVLIFSSDMPGGFGGTDLYYCTRPNIKEAWSKPVNMGSIINTEGDEMFPTIYKDTTLFFSSTGHAGLGGLDIFEVAINSVEVKGIPINLGAPINSSLDDFSLIRDENGLSGFFSSNRRGNDDIYSFKYKPVRIELKGVLVDSKTNKPIANSNIELTHNGSKITLTTDALGNYNYILPENGSFQLASTVTGYETFTTALNTHNISSDTVITRNIGLNSLNDEIPCSRIYNITSKFIIYYDLDKSDIRNDAVPTLKEVIAFLKQNPDLEVVASSYTDSRGSVEYNIKLSQRRSKAAENYLIKHGIKASRIKSSFHGKANLVNHCADNVDCPESLQQLNRRTQFILLYKGRNIDELNCKTLSDIKE